MTTQRPAGRIRACLNHIRNLRLLLNNLSQLRLSAHINHFKDIHEMALGLDWAQRNLEHLMLQEYHQALGEQSQREELRAREFKMYAQNGEDGLLLYVFSKIGASSRKVINLGCGGSSNTANLIINFGWSGLEIDGGAENIRRSAEFYTDKIGAERAGKLIFKQCWITRENINQTIEESGIGSEVDLLSVDIDGNDYWIWEALDIVQPRVVIMEYNASFGAARSISVKYEADFERWAKHPSGWYHGASLAALEKLGRRKGYALLGCDSNGVNALFAREDLISGKFRAVTPVEAFYSHFLRINKMSDEAQFETIKGLAYVEI